MSSLRKVFRLLGALDPTSWDRQRTISATRREQLELERVFAEIEAVARRLPTTGDQAAA